MRGTLTGDFAGLSVFTDKIGKLGSSSSMTALSKALADEALFQVQVGFSREQDPYGRPWFPKKYPNGKKILRAGGQLEKSFYRKYAGPDGAIIGSRARHATFAQTGTGVFGPSKSPIRSKSGKALRFKVGGKYIFRKQVEGSRQRLLVPLKGKPSVTWMRAFKQRAIAHMKARLGGKRAA